jgi:hypothetical protein
LWFKFSQSFAKLRQWLRWFVRGTTGVEAQKLAVIWRATLNAKLSGVLAEILARRPTCGLAEQVRAFHVKASLAISAGISSSLIIDLVQSSVFGYRHTSIALISSALQGSVWPAAGPCSGIKRAPNAFCGCRADRSRGISLAPGAKEDADRSEGRCR